MVLTNYYLLFEITIIKPIFYILLWTKSFMTSVILVDTQKIPFTTSTTNLTTLTKPFFKKIIVKFDQCWLLVLNNT